MNTPVSPAFEKATYDRVFWRVVPFLFLCYFVAFLDRVNIGFAKLQMAGDLQFSDTVYGFGAGIFFIGYFIFEVPSNVILEKVGARIWIARIMITWGIISSCFMFVQSEFWFYTLRFLLGAAEAGFFPGVILYLTYWFPASRRARMTALFLTAVAISNVIGSPISGGIMQYMDGLNGWRGWQWLFLMEGIPSVLLGFLVLALFDNGPKQAKWLKAEERDLVISRLQEDESSKQNYGQKHHLLDAFRDLRVWSLAIVYLCANVGFYAVNFWMPTIIQELGVDKHDFMKVGLLNMIPWGLAAVTMVLVGGSSDRTGERRWHTAISLLVATLGLLALALVGHAPVPSMIALTLVTAGLLSTVAVFWSLPTAFLSGTAAAAGIAWINSVGSLGGYFGPDLIGRIRTATGSTEAAFFVLAGIALFGAIIVLAMKNPKPPAVAPMDAP